MGNRFFSVIIVPDCGSEIKSGSFTSNFILGVFGALIVTFFVCAFFIIGYHIKLSQEKDYRQAVSALEHLQHKIRSSRDNLASLNARLSEIHRNDQAYRLHAWVDVVPEDSMYRAGIGGTSFIGGANLDGLTDDLRVAVEDIYTDLASVASQVSLQKDSFANIQVSLQKKREIQDNTPSILPTPTRRVTSPYGWRRHPLTGKREFHAAIDLGGNRGDPIRATANGEVIYAGWKGGLGRCVIIRHKYNYETLYAHLSKINVTVGDAVEKRDVIGQMGSTGTTNGTHLHYCIIHLNKKVNPFHYL